MILFNITFNDGNYTDVFSRLRKGEFMVAPSGPGLSTIDKDKRYWQALIEADFAIPDSGFMVMLVRLFLGFKIKKLSGPKFLRSFLKENILREPNKLFLIDPTEKESVINKKYLNSLDIPITSDYQYIAPFYPKEEIYDKKLLNQLNNIKEKPKFIIINLGGGVQEPLGQFIKENLSYRVAIICTGAAIAFETGQQAKLPRWVDEWYLGWLARIVQNPNLFLTRFLKAFRLIYVFYLWKTKKLK